MARPFLIVASARHARTAPPVPPTSPPPPPCKCLAVRPFADDEWHPSHRPPRCHKDPQADMRACDQPLGLGHASRQKHPCRHATLTLNMNEPCDTGARRGEPHLAGHGHAAVRHLPRADTRANRPPNHLAHSALSLDPSHRHAPLPCKSSGGHGTLSLACLF